MATKDALITRISDQIMVEEEEGRALEEGKRWLNRTQNTGCLCRRSCSLDGPAICWGDNISPMNVLMMWVVGSFFIYMFYFFLMMIHSLGSDSTHHLLDANAQIHIWEFMRLANLLRTVKKIRSPCWKRSGTRFSSMQNLWRRGLPWYAVDIICAAVLYREGVINLSMFLIVGAQMLVILAFYAKLCSQNRTPRDFSSENPSHPQKPKSPKRRS